MTILIDVDGVLCDYVGGCCDALRAQWDVKNYEPSDFKQWDMSQTLAQPDLARLGWSNRCRDFCWQLQPYKNASKAVMRLRELDTVVAVTAPLSDAQYWCSERTRWLATVLDFEEDDIIFAAGRRKALIQGKVLIEDNVSNLATWLHANPTGRGVLINRPWNALGSIDSPDGLRARRCDLADLAEVVASVYRVSK